MGFLGFCVQKSSFFAKVQEKLRKKGPNLINAQDLIIVQGGFFPKTINAQYLMSMHRVDFDPKTISAQLCFY